MLLSSPCAPVLQARVLHHNRIAARLSLSLIALAAMTLPVACSAQTYYYPGPAAPVPVNFAPLSDEDLDQLTAPIALYPDPLVAQILPAATYPLDVVAAEQWSRANPTVPQQSIDAQPWDESVKALIHYPAVLDMMTNDIAWTQRLGEAYINQPADVMNSIQRLRAQAQAAGSLISTPQQQVVVDDGEISIIPAQPEVIYIPEYDPATIYIRRGPLRFSPGFGIGIWLDKDTDWHRHWINEGVHWDHTHWDHREHPVPHGPAYHPQPHPDVHQWQRNPEKPVIVHVDHPQHDEHHGYAPPHAAPTPPPIGDIRPRQEVEHEEARGRQSLHQPAPVHAPPHVDTPRPAAHAPPPNVNSPQPSHPPPPRVDSPQPAHASPPPEHNDAGHGAAPGHH